MSSIKLSPNASGTGEFTIAAPNSNTNRTLNLPDASGTILTNSGTEAGAFSTLAVAGNNISAVNGVNFRNRIINGDMVIDQRNAGASVTPTTDAQYGSCDRWSYFISQTSKFSVQQNAGAVTPPAGFTNYLGVTSLSAYTLIGNDNFEVVQKIEGFNASDLNWGTANAQPVTLSFWVRSSLTGTFGGGISNSAYNRSYPFAYTINAANTWEQKTITIPGDTSGTWLTTNGIGLVLQFCLGAVAARTSAAGVWAAGWFPSATGPTSVVSTNGATFYITGVQLEAGSVATPFERLPITTELALCQRYYTRFNHFYFRIYQTSGSFGGQTLTMPVVMRASPTLTRVGTWTVGGCNQPIVEAASGDGTRSFNLAAQWTANTDGFFVTTDSSMFITASAEL